MKRKKVIKVIWIILTAFVAISMMAWTIGAAFLY